jgi:hypothetical protein
MLAPEDENEADVRREDQDRINQFARLNARRHDNTMERDQIKVTIYIRYFVLMCGVCGGVCVCVCAMGWRMSKMNDEWIGSCSTFSLYSFIYSTYVQYDRPNNRKN